MNALLPKRRTRSQNQVRRRQISVQQVKITLIAALLLGLITGIFQLLLDIRNEASQRQATVTQVMDMLNEAAAQAAYALDEQLAARVVSGLLMYQPIWRAEIYDNYGRLMAMEARPRDGRMPEWVQRLLQADDEMLIQSLYSQRDSELVGEMRVSVDGSLLAHSIVTRAWTVLLTGVVRNFILALILAVLFYYTLTRPLLTLVGQLERADPRQPHVSPIEVPPEHKDDEFGLLAARINTIFAVGADHVAERNREVQQRRISEARFRDFANAASDWFWERNADFDLVYSSQAGGASPEVAYDHMLRDESGHADAAWVNHRADLAARRPFRDFRFRVAIEPDDVRHYSLSGVPVFDDKGNFTGYRGAGTDITRRVAIEEEVERGRELLHSVLEAIPARISVKDTRGRYLLVNRSLTEAFQTEASEMIGRHLSELPLRGLAPESRADFIRLSNAAEEELLRDPRAFLNREHSYRAADGTMRTILESKVPVHDSDGRVTAILTVAVDISERKYAEQALDEANTRLRNQAKDLERLASSYAREREHAVAANRAKSEFLANMSHELRTPLNAIIGFAEVIVLRMWGPSSEKYFDYAQDIVVSARHLLHVINDILDMSKIEAGRYELSLDAHQLSSVVEDCLTIVKGRAREAQIAIVNEFPHDIPAARFDARAIKQVLLNLLSNAIKFTPPGGQVRIAGLRESDGTLVVSVSDTGIGIRPEYLPRIFEPFWQGDPNISRSGEGSGLGLAISRKFMELHGGTLEIESVENRGTTAVIRLPAAPAEA
jgi:PAS domain S-box-containing protein